jgi:hypothetical protein
MPDRQSVQGVAVGLPLGHELIHQGHETRVVRRFEQVNHLVNNNVFEASLGFQARSVFKRIEPAP